MRGERSSSLGPVSGHGDLVQRYASTAIRPVHRRALRGRRLAEEHRLSGVICVNRIAGRTHCGTMTDVHFDTGDALLVQLLNFPLEFGRVRGCAKDAAVDGVTGLNRIHSGRAVAATFPFCPTAAAGRMRDAVNTAMLTPVLLIVLHSRDSTRRNYPL